MSTRPPEPEWLIQWREWIRAWPPKCCHVTGVFRHAQTGRWQAQIRIGGTSIHLGSFEAFDDAVAARRKAEEQYGFHKNHGI